MKIITKYLKIKMNPFQKTMIRGFPNDYPVLSFLLIQMSTAGFRTFLILKKCHHTPKYQFKPLLEWL